MQQAHGIVNVGNTCYLNTALQSIKSLPNFLRDIQKLERFLRSESMKSNSNNKEILEARYNIINKILSDSQNMGIDIIRLLKNYSMHADKYLIDRLMQAHSQQDSHEALMIITDAIYGGKSIPSMYIRTRVKIICSLCKAMSKPNDEYSSNLYSNSLYIKKDLLSTYKPPFFNHYLEYEDEVNYECETCKKKSISIKYSKITVVKDIIIIVLPYKDQFKLSNPESLGFTDIIDINTKNGLQRYKLVSVADKSGNQLGGHWYGNFQRSNGIYNISDLSCSPTDHLRISENTIYIIYHII